MSKNSNNDVARASYGIILILALFTRYVAILKPNCDMIRFNSVNSIFSQLFSYFAFCFFFIKLKIELKKVIEPFNFYFFQPKLISLFSFIRKYYITKYVRWLVLISIFSKLHTFIYLCDKFHTSRVIVAIPSS